MADDKQRKVDSGRALLNSYMRKKNDFHGRSGDVLSNEVDSVSEAAYSSTTERNTHKPEKVKMDHLTLLKKQAQFDSLSTTIKNLQDTLLEKNEIIDCLEIENKVLREGTGDHLNLKEHEKNTIKELRSMVDARDTLINQLSESLQTRSDELGCTLKKENELNAQIQTLEQEIRLIKMQSGEKLAESYNGTIEYKAKVDMLTNQIQGYSELICSLKSSLESSNKKLEFQQQELDEKKRSLEKCKNEASEDIKRLMRQVEILNQDVFEKEGELLQSKKKVEMLRNEMEEKFGVEIVALKNELEKKYADDIKNVEVLYDGMLLEHIRKSDMDLKTANKCTDLEAQISACRLSYEAEINNYKEQLKKLLERSKINEEQLLRELDRHRQEADHYRQQVENLENKLAEEVQKIKYSCQVELDKCAAEITAQKENCYQEELEKLSIQLKEYAISEAKKEVELETLRNNLIKSENEIVTLIDELKACQDESATQKEQLVLLESEMKRYEKSNFELQVCLSDLERSEHQLLDELKLCKEELSDLRVTIREFQEKENQLLQELKYSQDQVLEYKKQIVNSNEQVKYESNEFSEKYNAVRQMYNEQIQQLMSELERNKTFYENDLMRLNSQTNEQNNEIKNLEAKIRYLLEIKARDDDTAVSEKQKDSDAMYDQTMQLNIFQQKLFVAEKLRTNNKEFLSSILVSLRQIRNGFKNLLKSETENTSERNVVDEAGENVENFTHEVLTRELENTVYDLLSLTQLAHESLNDNNSFDIKEPNLKYNIVTSTPSVQVYYTAERKNHPVESSYWPDSDKNAVEGLMQKCARLENENERLLKELEMLTSNLKEMEHCLLIASQESHSFDKKCKVLDAKVTDLETLKLNEYLLKKENNELKERLKDMETNESEFRQHLAILNKNNIKLEEMLNKSVLELHSKLSNGEENVELDGILANLKEKSEEVISLKTQMASLQKLGMERKSKINDIQIQYQQLLTKCEVLSGELKNKQKELEEVWNERNKISSDNKLLLAKVLSLQEKTSCNTFNTLSKGSNSADKGVGVGRQTKPHSVKEDIEQFHINTLKTMELLSSHSFGQLEKPRNGVMSTADKISYEIQMLDQQTANAQDAHDSYLMPTIPEEDDQEEAAHDLRQEVSQQQVFF